ncbi:MAG: acetoacetate decarboxylase family protein [Chloroflexota bacterium]|nr:acetoacetate decarboxylase family protein [Chloroflexota bacterium]
MSLPAAPRAGFGTYEIQGQAIRLPVEVRDATTAVAFYLVSAGAAQALIDPSGLRVAMILPGRTVCSIGSVDYRDNDLGRYHEIAIAFFVREPNARTLPFVGTLLGLLRGSLAAYIKYLPVDAEFTCEAGQRIWGFPKFMSEIAITATGDRQSSMLTVEGKHVLTPTVATGGSRAMPARDQISYALRDGVLYRTRASMRGGSIGIHLRGAPLQLGTHPVADELRTLGLPKRPLASMTIDHMSATFYAPEARSPVVRGGQQEV